MNPKVLSLPDYRVGNLLEANNGTKKIILEVFPGVTTSGPTEHTGFSRHLRIQCKQNCIPLAISEATGIQDEHGHSARGSGMSKKRCLCSLCPSASFGRAHRAGEPQTLRREGPEQHHSNISVRVS